MRLVRQSLWFAVLLFMAVPLQVRADAWSAPAAELAHKVASKTGPKSAVTVDIRNNSSLPASEAVGVRSQILSQLQSAGIRIAEPSQAVASVTVTLSENAQQYLWIAKIQQGSTEDVVMIGVPRPQSTESRSASPMALRIKLLLVQDDPILDVVLRADSAIVLSPSKVTHYRVLANEWQQLVSLPILHTRPFPRDLRGRLWTATENALDVSLPGVRCTQLDVQQSVLTCTETDDPWPPSTAGSQIRMTAFYAPVRNFFNGTVTFQGDATNAQTATYNLPSFYSAAVVLENGLPLWLFSGVDGRVTFFGGQRGAGGSTGEVRNWGSDIASIVSPCGQDRMILASRNGDYTAPDSVQAFRLANRDVVPLTAPVEFAGPITALWNSSVDGQSVIAVSRNLKTGKFEAYALSLACNQ